MVAGDTAGVSLGLGGFASRQTVTAGSSVLLAAQRGRRQGEEGRQPRAGSRRARSRIGRRRGARGRRAAAHRSSSARSRASCKGAPGYGFPPGVDPGLEANVNCRTDALAYANACHVAEVEVDVETGEVHILRYVALQDSGVLINPMMVEGQIHGGVAHGIGNALYEWMGYDDGGQPVTTTFADYLLPTATEVPMMTTLYKETPSPLNPLGVKGVGEVSDDPAAAAVISAVEDALHAVQRADRPDAADAGQAGRADRQWRKVLSSSLPGLVPGIHGLPWLWPYGQYELRWPGQTRP